MREGDPMKYSMTERRRELIFRVADGCDETLPILHFLDSLSQCDQILTWLIFHNLTGARLCEFQRTQFGTSLLGMAKFILMQVNREKEERPLIVGRDIKV
jgi:hypothetical protein